MSKAKQPFAGAPPTQRMFPNNRAPIGEINYIDSQVDFTCRPKKISIIFSTCWSRRIKSLIEIGFKRDAVENVVKKIACANECAVTPRKTNTYIVLLGFSRLSKDEEIL